jgi:hypothetical protein
VKGLPFEFSVKDFFRVFGEKGTIMLKHKLKGILIVIFIQTLVPITAFAEYNYRENTDTVFELYKNACNEKKKLAKFLEDTCTTYKPSNLTLATEIETASKNGYVKEAARLANRHLFQMSQSRDLNLTNLCDFMCLSLVWSDRMAKILSYVMTANWERVFDKSYAPGFFARSLSFLDMDKDMDSNDIANRYRDFCSKAVSAIHKISNNYTENFRTVIFSTESDQKHLQRELDWCPVTGLFTNMDHGEHVEDKMNCVNYSVSTLSVFEGETSFPNVWIDALEAYGDIKREYLRTMQIVKHWDRLISQQLKQNQINVLREKMEIFAKYSESYFDQIDKLIRIYLVDVPVILYTTKYLENIRSNHRSMWFDQKDEMMPWALKFTQLVDMIRYCVLPTTTVYYQSAASYAKKYMGSKRYSQVESQSRIIPLWINSKRIFDNN